MSTSQDLRDNKKPSFMLRKAFSNKRTINVNLPLKICKSARIKPQDYLVVEYNDKLNNITFTKLEDKFPLVAKSVKGESNEYYNEDDFNHVV